MNCLYPFENMYIVSLLFIVLKTSFKKLSIYAVRIAITSSGLCKDIDIA